MNKKFVSIYVRIFLNILCMYVVVHILIQTLNDFTQASHTLNDL